MLNRKKNYVWAYVLGAVILAGLVWLMSREMPFNEETVEEPLERTLTK
mgnify:CR=1 FL=1